MKKTVLEIGIPQSDGDYLLYGFGYPEDIGGVRCRWMGEEGKILLPGKITGLQIETFSLIPQKVKITIDGRKIATIKIPVGKWLDHKIKITTTARKGSVLTLLSQPETSGFQHSCFGYHNLAISTIFLTSPEVLQTRKRRVTSVHPQYYGDETIHELTHQFHKYKKFFWGDPHVHTNISLCDAPYEGNIKENIYQLKERLELDFASLTDHAEHMTKKQEKETRKAWKDYTEEEKFVLLPGYEWTSAYFGHMNVYSIKDDLPILSSNKKDSDTPRKLWESLKNFERKCITIPHHPAKKLFPFCWDFYNSVFLRGVEIYSKWGSSEKWKTDLQPTMGQYCTYPGLSAQNALMKGYKLGFLGGGDCHILRAGTRGITGVLLKKLTSESLFEALYNRRTVASTGPKTQIYFSVNNHLMGEEIIVNRYQMEKMMPLTLYVEVSSPQPIECVELIENNQVIRRETISTTGGYFVLPFHRREEEVDVFKQFSFVHTEIKGLYSRFYYVRVINRNRHHAWCSPIWLTLKEEK